MDKIRLHLSKHENELKYVPTIGINARDLDANKIKYHQNDVKFNKRIFVECDWDGNPILDERGKYSIPCKSYKWIENQKSNVIFYFSNHSMERYVQRFCKKKTAEDMTNQLYDLARNAELNKRIMNDTSFMLYRMEQGDDPSSTVYYNSGDAVFVCRYVCPEHDKRHLFVITIINHDQKIKIDTSKGKKHVTPYSAYKYK